MFGQFIEPTNKMRVFSEVKENNFAIETEGLFLGIWQLLSKLF